MDKIKEEINQLIDKATDEQLLNLIEVGFVDYDSLGILPIKDVIKENVKTETSQYRIKLIMMILKENRIFNVKEYYGNEEINQYQIANIEDNLLIDEWLKYIEDKRYAPLQNLNKMLNYIYNVDLYDSEYEEIASNVKDAIESILAYSDGNKEQLLTYIKNDEEFLDFIKVGDKND